MPSFDVGRSTFAVRRSAFSLLASLLLAGCALPVATGWTDERPPLDEPWSASVTRPVFADATARGPRTANARADMASAMGFLLLAFYQKTLSAVMVSHCPLEPSCSNYSIQAIRKHGFLRGYILTADRLLHEADEQRLTPLVLTAQRGWRHYDPVSANDYWWSRTP